MAVSEDPSVSSEVSDSVAVSAVDGDEDGLAGDVVVLHTGGKLTTVSSSFLIRDDVCRREMELGHRVSAREEGTVSAFSKRIGKECRNLMRMPVFSAE